MLIGHKLLVKNFKTLVNGGRLAHGYLFFGLEGVGKKTFALGLAGFLETGKFDDEVSRTEILGDLFLISPNEKMTIGIDEARVVKDFLSRRPNRSLRRTVVIDEAEFLTTEAQNALLKITEEPPESGLLILIVRDPEIFMATLGSRLQKIYFAGLKTGEVEEWLKMNDTRFITNDKKHAGEEIKNAVEGAMGSPGLALKLLSDEKFRNLKDQAEEFLSFGEGSSSGGKTSGSTRKDLIKALIEPENFNFLEFLDALIINLANKVQMGTNIQIDQAELRLWHRVLKLRQDVSNFPLNPKLQLQALANYE